MKWIVPPVLLLLPFLGCLSAAPIAQPNDFLPKDKAVEVKDYNLYLALGSSSTAGAGASAESLQYVQLLHNNLGNDYTDITLDNRGLGGRRLMQMPSDLIAISTSDTALVTILPFTDYVYTQTEQFEEHARALLDELARYDVTVLWGRLFVSEALICGVGEGPGGCYSQEDHDMLKAKGDVIKGMQDDYDFLVIAPIEDMNVPHPEWNGNDGHPNDEGHAYLAQKFIDAMVATNILKQDDD